jgi:hypothetical protein
MAFKGGTSLSKVYNLINRFSEDVDVTLDYRGFGKDYDLFSGEISKTKLKNISLELKSLVYEHVHKVVKPYFIGLLQVLLKNDYIEPEVSEDGEKVWIYYPSALEDSNDDYLKSSVLIEFGGRNITEPNQEHIIRSYLADVFPELEFPTARVDVLSPIRTFWEKVTLIHSECHRKEYRANAHRLSRHWYDLALLSKSEIGGSVLGDFELLSDVIKYKKIFYFTSYSNYDACLQGKFRLVPDDPFIVELERDFKGMLNSGMFYGQLPSFEETILCIKNLERELNELRLVGG